MIDQEELSSMLNEIASYERGFKQQAFINAASAIISLSEDKFKNYIESGNYTSIHGVGKSVATCIDEFIKTGSMSRLEKHRENNLGSNPLLDV